MLDRELLLKIMRRAVSSGAQYADVFVERRRATFISLEDGKVEKNVIGVDAGAGIRVIADGKTVFAFTNDLTEEGLLGAAAGLAKAAAGGAQRDIDLRVLRPEIDFPIRERPEGVPMEEKISLVRGADLAARGASPEGIRQVSVVYRDTMQQVQIANSEGFLTEEERVHTVGLVTVVAARGDVVQTGHESMGGLAGFELFDGEVFAKAAAKAAQRAVRMLGARRAPGGRMPVVISSDAGGTMIHEAIGHGLEADLACRGLSRFSGMMGKEVASPLVTVVDDSTLPGKRGSFRFDDEGTPSSRTVLVTDGVLTNYMYDRLSSMREGVPSTGNGRRESYRHRPIPRMTNTFLAPGSSSPEEVLRSTPRGLLVRKMGGGQVNTVTGDFVFDVMEGYLIEDGQVGELVRGATLTGNGPDVLRGIDLVASDLGFSIGTCGKDGQGAPVSDAMPTVRIPEMVVGGEV